MIFAANNMQLQTQNEDHHSSNVAMSSAIAAPKGKSVRKVAAAGTAPDVNIEMPDLQEAQRLGRKFKVGPTYELIKEIGAGSYGEVVLARHIDTRKLVAIKKIDQVFNIVQDAKR